jgi:hypothetical protein
MGYHVREDGGATRPLPLLPPLPAPAPAATLGPLPTEPRPDWGEVLGSVIGLGIVLLAGAGIAAAFAWWVLIPLARGLP